VAREADIASSQPLEAEAWMAMSVEEALEAAYDDKSVVPAAWPDMLTIDGVLSMEAAPLTALLEAHDLDTEGAPFERRRRLLKCMGKLVRGQRSSVERAWHPDGGHACCSVRSARPCV